MKEGEDGRKLSYHYYYGYTTTFPAPGWRLRPRPRLEPVAHNLSPYIGLNIAQAPSVPNDEEPVQKNAFRAAIVVRHRRRSSIPIYSQSIIVFIYKSILIYSYISYTDGNPKFRQSLSFPTTLRCVVHVKSCHWLSAAAFDKRQKSPRK